MPCGIGGMGWRKQGRALPEQAGAREPASGVTPCLRILYLPEAPV